MSTLQYVQPTEEQKAVMQQFRDKYEALFNELKTLPNQGSETCKHCWLLKSTIEDVGQADLTADWKKRLDTVEFGFDVDRKKLEPFIQSLLDTQRKELMEKVEGMRRKLVGHGITENDVWRIGYNRCLDDVLEALKEQTE